MDNASRALIMAATVLLGVLLITMFVYIFSEGSKVSQNYDIQQQANQLELYNSKFEYYNRKKNNIMDIISVCNLAFDVNDSTKSSDGTYDNTNAIKITVDIGTAHFEIPDKESKGLRRNQILYNNIIISIYDLASKNLSEERYRR